MNNQNKRTRWGEDTDFCNKSDGDNGEGKVERKDVDSGRSPETKKLKTEIHDVVADSDSKGNEEEEEEEKYLPSDILTLNVIRSIVVDKDRLSTMTEERDNNGKLLHLCVESHFVKRRYILVRCFYEDLFSDILKNICRSRRYMSEELFIPQCCFLIYGNESVGKSALLYYLAYQFMHKKEFDKFDIIICSTTGNSSNQASLVRFGLRKGETTRTDFNKYVDLQELPGRTKSTIIISDNVPISEEDFTNDDIIIMLSSPNACKYKVFRDKRQPIQYYIPQIDGTDLEKLLAMYKLEKFLKLCKEFGGNLINMKKYIEGGLESMIAECKDNRLYSYIPDKYNEKIFIYDIIKFNDIPTKLRFLSDEIGRMILFRNIMKFRTTEVKLIERNCIICEENNEYEDLELTEYEPQNIDENTREEDNRESIFYDY